MTMDMDGGDLVGVLRTRWPSELAEAEDLLTSAGIPFEVEQLYDGEEWELRVPRELADDAREVITSAAGA